ncbi:[alpha-L-fucopyranosyl-(1-_3)-alpha-L-rhamnopyran osyl-(1-_3)-2-O-methyl-alpha-L-rhamnopyranosyl] dimycocerosyl phenol-phthiocerol 2'''-O-methyltransferase [Pseudonocardia ailaonensis]|uniref:[alpha-L-fucopyranosyl-(1->3)-alpha-L-rhamnopyran osyl-(1->3)-2-O-methyl-alpha-L-rhamnopyranosyl] dimycocerosyl phenol-phthiocerol 2'''-O-methyltransferase n=1 Tax=Pseudonocardia ailaonensis TaxID=367279 RepID=A0ABN2NAY0_9PSEU
MNLREQVRQRFEAVGLELARHPLHPVVKGLRHEGVDTVVDVGANSGQYGANLRRLGFTGRIVSFEPVAEACAAARRRSAKDARWSVQQLALGAEPARVEIHVAANGAASSSVLRMLPAHEDAAPEAKVVRSEDVEQQPLDEVWDQHVGAGGRAFLKIDVQGYERHVLDGATRVLADGLVAGLQLELSYVALYEGGWNQAEALAWADGHGFELFRILPGFSDAATGRMLQADGIFFRRA